MYESIEGRTVEKHPTEVVLECNGIAYRLQVSLNTSSQVSGESCKLYTHLVVREDAMLLYGFYDRDERSIFRQLIDVSGIGPNTAVLILSSMTPSEVRNSILEEDVEAFKKVKGVGARTAQRVIVDLKERLEKAGMEIEERSASHNSERNEALSALTALGFDREKGRKALEKANRSAEGELSVEDLVKNALKHL